MKNLSIQKKIVIFLAVVVLAAIGIKIKGHKNSLNLISEAIGTAKTSPVVAGAAKSDKHVSVSKLQPQAQDNSDTKVQNPMDKFDKIPEHLSDWHFYSKQVLRTGQAELSYQALNNDQVLIARSVEILLGVSAQKMTLEQSVERMYCIDHLHTVLNQSQPEVKKLAIAEVKKLISKLSQNLPQISVENQKNIAGDIIELYGSVKEANAESALEIAALLQQTKIAKLIAKQS